MVKHISVQTPELSIAHLRKGSVGSVLPENTHPFVFDNWSLCHNGMLFESENIPLSDDIHSRIQGTSDTERIFLSIMDNLQKKSQAPKDIRASIIQVITYIRKHHDYMALNILLSNGRKLWAVREVNEKNAMVKRLRLRTYFSLYVARNRQKQITALCSEKLRVPTSVWKPLPNHCLLEIDIRTYRERQYPISGSALSRG
jgi:predicted glutamine amidotransferase